MIFCFYIEITEMGILKLLIILILSEEEFLLLRKQDQKIIGKLFTQNQKDIYNFLIVKTRGNFDVTNDILSETFLSAYKSAPKLKNNKNLKSWLIKIAHRKMIDYQRKLFREKKIIQKEKEQIPQPEDFNDTIHRKQKALLYTLALDKLNLKYKKILKLKYKDEKSIKEITVILDQSEAYVINMINRAKAALKREMRKICLDFFED